MAERADMGWFKLEAELMRTEEQLKEKLVLSDLIKTVGIVVSLLFVMGTFVFSSLHSKVQEKTFFEYRPIVVTNRTVVAATAYQPSLTRFTALSVSVKILCTSTLAGGQDGTSSLQVSRDNGATDPYVSVASVQSSNSVSLAIAITATGSNGSPLVATVPPGYYYKIVNTSTTGTPTFSILTPAQETSL